ncbi:MAG: NADH:ubiquinone oxidoreductase subunit N, partial [Woeseia sp.]
MRVTDFMPAAPEMVLLGLICAVLLIDLMVRDEKRVVTFWLSIAALAVTAIALLVTAPEGRVITFD